MAAALLENGRIHHHTWFTRKDGRVTQRPLFSWNRREGVSRDRAQVIDEWRKQVRPVAKQRTDRYEAWTTTLPASDQPSGFWSWANKLHVVAWVAQVFG